MAHYEFSAGPATLPSGVLAEAQRQLVDHDGLGRSLVEMSHRGKTVTAVVQEAEATLRELLAVPDDYAVLFMQGGGTGQFAAVPLNLSGPAQGATVADYITTGTWTAKAVAEAKKYIDARELVNAKKSKGAFTSIPPASEWSAASDGAAYLYYTDNETVNGVEFAEPPKPASADCELVCDMSSNFLSRPVDVSKFGLIFAGAQKNCGVAGVTIVIVKKSLLGRHRAEIPVVMEYQSCAEKESMYNTPPVWPIYIAGLVFKWIKEQGGIAEMAKRADERSQALYNAIDESNGFYNAPVEKGARSRMNVVFRVKNGDKDLEAKFVSEAEKRNLHTLKGHRSVGGLRASLYNAMEMDGVRALLSFMKEFQEANQ